MKLTTRIATLALAFVLAALPAAAQVDPAFHDIFQQDLVSQRWVKVGEIFVPEHASRELYVEHWVLFPGYVYPSTLNQKNLRIVASKEFRYENEADFFRRVPFPAGSRYVQVTANDTENLPCR